MAALPIALPKFDNTVGAEFLGIILVVLIFGIAIMQTHIYYQTYEDDSVWMKGYVAFIMALTTLSSIFLIHGMYYYIVTNYGNPTSLRHDIWSFVWEALPQILVVSAVQFFYAKRIYHLSNQNKIFPALVVALSLVANVSKAVALGNTWGDVNTGDAPPPSQRNPSYLSQAAQVACDILIVALLTYFLHQNRSGLKRTDKLINSLILYTVSSGLITSVLAVVSLATFITMPNNTIYWAFSMLTCGSYTNAVLASLNGRRALREKNEVNGHIDLPLRGIQGSGGSGSSDSRARTFDFVSRKSDNSSHV